LLKSSELQTNPYSVGNSKQRLISVYGYKLNSRICEHQRVLLISLVTIDIYSFFDRTPASFTSASVLAGSVSGGTAFDGSTFNGRAFL